jgi:hypothetical protein
VPDVRRRIVQRIQFHDLRSLFRAVNKMMMCV